MSKMPSHLKRRAWAIAADWVSDGAHAFDLPSDLTDAEQEMVRGYMQSAITKDMRNKGNAGLAPHGQEVSARCSTCGGTGEWFPDGSEHDVSVTCPSCGKQKSTDAT